MNVLNDEQIARIMGNPEVMDARSRLENRDTLSFLISLDHDIKHAIYSRLGLDLFHIEKIPMRWIKKDTAPHIDVGPTDFENTYLIYLQDDPGQLIIDDIAYPIRQGSGFVFGHNLSHGTINTLPGPRLMIGPMNEMGIAVGASTTFYYANEGDALTNTNLLAQYGSYTIIPYPNVGTPIYSNWYIASTSTGSSPQDVLYHSGDELNADGGTAMYYLYPGIPCFMEGSKILCIEKDKECYVPIEEMNPGTLVKTHAHGYKKIVAIGSTEIYNKGDDERRQNRLYILKKEKYQGLEEDLIVTGQHSILVDNLTEIQRKIITSCMGKIYITNDKYRLMAFADERAEPLKIEGKYNVWHLALENECKYSNYGVYANGGLLVETSSIRYMTDFSNMKLK